MYARQSSTEWRDRYDRDREQARRMWAVWFLVYLMLSLSLLAASFVPWLVLDDTDSAIAVAEIIPYALDGPDRDWLAQETGVHGLVFLYTPFILVPFLVYMAVRAALGQSSPTMFLVSLAGFVLVSLSASVAVEASDHAVIYGFVVTEVILIAATISLLGFLLKRFEGKITFRLIPLMTKGGQGSDD